MDENELTEYDYWNWWIPQFGKFFSADLPLLSPLTKLIGNKSEINIADLGSGAFSLIGNVYREIKINVSPSDLLANEYKSLYERFQIYPNIPIEQQDMTCLTYEDEKFDIVYCRNSLDHCSDPKKALSEMFRVCKKDGWIYLDHIINVAENEHYYGLHQWNIEPFKEDCRIWNKKTSFLLSQFGIFKHIIEDGWIASMCAKP
jgi:ubiquinone/menaquinone biosynthesis C-methylase UbiE